MATDPEGKKLYTIASDGNVRYWEIKTGKALLAFQAHHGPIISMNVNHRLMYTASTDGMAKCWVTEHGDNTVTYKEHSLSVTLIKFYKGLGKLSIVWKFQNYTATQICYVKSILEKIRVQKM